MASHRQKGGTVVPPSDFQSVTTRSPILRGFPRISPRGHGRAHHAYTCTCARIATNHLRPGSPMTRQCVIICLRNSQIPQTSAQKTTRQTPCSILTTPRLHLTYHPPSTHEAQHKHPLFTHHRFTVRLRFACGSLGSHLTRLATLSPLIQYTFLVHSKFINSATQCNNHSPLYVSS